MDPHTRKGECFPQRVNLVTPYEKFKIPVEALLLEDKYTVLLLGCCLSLLGRRLWSSRSLYHGSATVQVLQDRCQGYSSRSSLPGFRGTQEACASVQTKKAMSPDNQSKGSSHRPQAFTSDITRRESLSDPNVLVHGLMYLSSGSWETHLQQCYTPNTLIYRDYGTGPRTNGLGVGLPTYVHAHTPMGEWSVLSAPLPFSLTARRTHCFIHFITYYHGYLLPHATTTYRSIAAPCNRPYNYAHTLPTHVQFERGTCAMPS